MKIKSILLPVFGIFCFSTFAQTPKQLEDSLRKIGSTTVSKGQEFIRVADSIKKANTPVIFLALLLPPINK